jgi:hypothetical protein
MCNGSGRWIPLEAVSPLVDSALKRAGVSKAIGARVAAEVDTAGYILGQVTHVATWPGKRRVRVMWTGRAPLTKRISSFRPTNRTWKPSLSERRTLGGGSLSIM